MYQPEPIVPRWIGVNPNAAFRRMPPHPVLIQVPSLGSVHYGEMLELTMTEATVQPTDSLYLWKRSRVNVRFAFADITYSLVGLSTVSDRRDHSFSFQFDQITRERMELYGVVLASSLDVGEGDPNSEPAPSEPEEDPATASHAEPVRHEPPPNGQERRRHTRFELEAEASLKVLGSGLQLKCTVVEISEGGCRLMTAEPNPILIAAEIEVQFSGLSFPLRLTGRVRHKQTPRTLGIEFTDLSDRVQARVRSFLEEIQEEQGVGSRE